MHIEGYLEDINFFADANDPAVTYAEVEVPAIGASSTPYRLFVNINDEKLKSYIRQFIIPNIGAKASASELIQDVKDIIALGGNPDAVAPRVRTAGKLSKGLIEYDLNSSDKVYVRVTPKGWELTRKSKHKFLKYSTLGAQVHPQKTDKNLISLLRPHINMDEDGLILFVAWLVQGFCTSSHPCALVESEAGSGKTTTARLARRVLDPSRLQATAMPEKKDDLLSALSNSYFVAWDNTEVLSQDVSNILAMATTGAAMAKRKYYSTNELSVYGLLCVVMLNGLDIMPAKADLASRCMLFNLKAIDEHSRKTDEEIETALEQDLPDILGAIFDTLSKAMTVIKTLKPQKLPRMAGAYREMLAIAVALGISEQKFELLFFENIAALDKARANIAIVEAVQEYLNSKFVTGRSVSGTVSELFAKICANYSGAKSDLGKSPSVFSRKLRQELKTFSAVGITVLLDNTYADGTHVKFIKDK